MLYYKSKPLNTFLFMWIHICMAVCVHTRLVGVPKKHSHMSETKTKHVLICNNRLMTYVHLYACMFNSTGNMICQTSLNVATKITVVLIHNNKHLMDT